MTQYKYTYQGYDEKKMARAVGLFLPISGKQAVEICNFLKHRSLNSAKNILNSVLDMKMAIPYKRFNKDIPHRRGIMAGRYPQNASKEILTILDSVEANANSKGLTKDLFITHMNAHRAPSAGRGGRTAGQAKRAHVEIIVEEKKVEKKKYTPKKAKK
jgi:large subunit ribosomal protein L22